MRLVSALMPLYADKSGDIVSKQASDVYPSQGGLQVELQKAARNDGKGGQGKEELEGCVDAELVHQVA